MAILSKAVIGALAGVAGTAAMSVAMRALFHQLPERDRYALPPREIISSLLQPAAGYGETSERFEVRATTLSHFGFGAVTGALFALGPKPTLLRGVIYGVTVWTASYLGWIPASGLLKPATDHPASRNGLMLLAHVVWGATLGATLREIERLEHEGFSGDRRHMLDL